MKGNSVVTIQSVPTGGSGVSIRYRVFLDGEEVGGVRGVRFIAALDQCPVVELTLVPREVYLEGEIEEVLLHPAELTIEEALRGVVDVTELSDQVRRVARLKVGEVAELRRAVRQFYALGGRQGAHTQREFYHLLQELQAVLAGLCGRVVAVAAHFVVDDPSPL